MEVATVFSRIWNEIEISQLFNTSWVTEMVFYEMSEPLHKQNWPLNNRDDADGYG